MQAAQFCGASARPAHRPPLLSGPAAFEAKPNIKCKVKANRWNFLDLGAPQEFLGAFLKLDRNESAGDLLDADRPVLWRHG